MVTEAGSNSGDGENCADSGYNLKVESVGFVESVSLRCKRKKSGII